MSNDLLGKRKDSSPSALRISNSTSDVDVRQMPVSPRLELSHSQGPDDGDVEPPAKPAEPLPVVECEFIWDEANLEQNIQFNSDSLYDVRCGTINKLIERLTLLDETENEAFKLYQAMFFMTYRSFVTAEEVLEKLIQRFEGPPGESEEDANARHPPQSKIRKATCLALVHWFTHHFRDFKQKESLQKRFWNWITEVYRAEQGKNVKDSLVPYTYKMAEKKVRRLP